MRVQSSSPFAEELLGAIDVANAQRDLSDMTQVEEHAIPPVERRLYYRVDIILSVI
jgi:hypothetical protein